MTDFDAVLLIAGALGLPVPLALAAFVALRLLLRRETDCNPFDLDEGDETHEDTNRE